MEQSRLGITHTPVQPSVTHSASIISPAPRTSPVPVDTINAMAAASNQMGTFKRPQGTSAPKVATSDVTGVDSAPKTIFYRGPSGSFRIDNATLADTEAVTTLASAPIKVARRTVASEYSGIGSFVLGSLAALGVSLFTPPARVTPLLALQGLRIILVDRHPMVQPPPPRLQELTAKCRLRLSRAIFLMRFCL